MEKLCVNTIVDYLLSLWSKEIAHPSSCSCFLSWGKGQSLTDVTALDISKTHTHSSHGQQQHYRAEMLICGTSVSCDQKCLLTLYSLTIAQITTSTIMRTTTTTHVTAHSTITTVSSQRKGQLIRLKPIKHRPSCQSCLF